MTLHKSFPAKVCAVILVILLAAFCMTAGAAVVYMGLEGYYNVGTESFYDTDQYYARTMNYASSARNFFADGDDFSEAGGYFSRERTNFAFEIRDRYNPEAVLAFNYQPRAPYREMQYQFDNLVIRTYVSDPITVRDNYYSAYSMFQWMYPNRYMIILGLAAGIILFIATLIFLLCGAGRRKNVEGVVLNLQDRIPLDLYLLAAGGATAFLILTPMDHLFFSGLADWALFGLCVLLAFMVLLAALLTVSTRFKAGKWWKNTLLFRLIRLLKKVFRALGNICATIFRGLPLIWKTALGFCVATGINIFFAYEFFYRSASAAILLLAFLFNLALFCAICFTALSLQRLKKAGEGLAAGDFELRVDKKFMFWDFARHADNLEKIGDGMMIAVEQRIKSERLKTELITNVSHDIKTPLTSIINYVDLLKREKLENTAGEYVEVLDRQSKRLKKLTEDLVEATRASTGNLSTDLTRTDVSELVSQSVGEYSERLNERGLEPVVTLPEEKADILADGKYLWRVMDNLLSNVCKYALSGTRVYLDVEKRSGEVAVTVRNISESRLNIREDELMERFIRGDESRSTEGSGLGLNIARSLIDLQKGRFAICIDGDLFKAEICFPEMT